MAEILVTAAAEADYLDALLWYAGRSQRAAEGFEAAFEQALQLITDSPYRFAMCNGRHRRFLMRRYPYQVVYRIEEDQPIVIATAHTKRKPRFWKER